MSYDPNSMQQTYTGAQRVDAGLQAYMRNVYNTMSLGLVLTGLTAFGVASIPALYHLLIESPLAFVVMLAPLGIIMFGFTPRRIFAMPLDRLTVLFSVFSVLMGASLASIFHHFTGASIARVFFITAGTFASMSLYGYTTRRDLAGVGSFMTMGLIGVILASLINIFLGSPMVQFVTSILSVVIFTGLTAWETQQLKLVYRDGAHDANARMAIAGALNLYMNFINIFLQLLQFLGDRK